MREEELTEGLCRAKVWSPGRRQQSLGQLSALSGGLRGGVCRNVEQSAVVRV